MSSTGISLEIDVKADDDPLIRVMIADDSSIIRGMVSRILDADDELRVVKAVSNGKLAVEAIVEVNPDVLILDIEMPVMDGLTALPLLHKKSPNTKIIIFSTLGDRGAAVSVKALSLGAADCLLKPSSFSQADPASYQENLLRIIREIGKYSRRHRLKKYGRAAPVSSVKKNEFTLRNDPHSYKGKPSIIAIGSSTGGPSALPVVLENLVGVDVPIVITQHMPPTFTAVLADSISKKLKIDCVEAKQDMRVKAGHVYIAPGGAHMKLRQEGMSVFVDICDGPKENFCKPSVEPMLRSVIDIYGRKALAIILTGMGKDGLEGCKSLIEKGGRMIAQDEESSVVWGMPGAVAMEGLCSAVLPLDKIGSWTKNTLVNNVGFVGIKDR